MDLGNIIFTSFWEQIQAYTILVMADKRSQTCLDPHTCHILRRKIRCSQETDVVSVAWCGATVSTTPLLRWVSLKCRKSTKNSKNSTMLKILAPRNNPMVPPTSAENYNNENLHEAWKWNSHKEIWTNYDLMMMLEKQFDGRWHFVTQIHHEGETWRKVTRQLFQDLSLNFHLA